MSQLNSVGIERLLEIARLIALSDDYRKENNHTK